jgi:hypothetical protein
VKNKPYVLGLLVPAVLLIAWAAKSYLGEGGLLALIPAALGIALIVAAIKVAKADTFAPSKQQRWDTGPKEDVQRWQERRSAREEAAAASSAQRSNTPTNR